MQFRTDVFSSEPMPEYRARRAEYLTSHQLIDYAACPLLYRKAMAGLVPKRHSEAFLIGAATHCLALEGRAGFERDYVVGGPINPKTDRPYGPDTKKFAEWAKATGKTALSDEQFALVCNMASAVRSHVLAKVLLADGLAEGVVRADYCGVACQIRVDWFNPHEGIVDLKTCDCLDAFEDDARQFHYREQMAFYRAIYQAATGDITPVHLIGVEKREPYRVGVWLVSGEALDIAERTNRVAIGYLVVSRRENVWPTHYEELRTLAA